MGWIFSKKELSSRQQFRDEFVTVTAKLWSADELTQVAVGHGLNLMTTAFMQRFGDIKTFSALPQEEKNVYIKSLTKAEEGLIAKDPYAALGIGLFKMWIGALTADDEELIRHFSKDLALISKKGDLSP